MNALEETLARVDTLTFDCYGTLIDWDAGLYAALAMIFGPSLAARRSELFDAYVVTEAEVESEGHQSYRMVLAETVRRLARRLKLPVAERREGLLADSLPSWRPFSDTNEALLTLKARYRLGVLSNIDRDLFAGTARHFPVSFDFVITAEEVGSYKPAPGHFNRLLEQHATSDRVLHVAQSLFHDGTAAERHDIAFVWINRYGHSNQSAVRPLAALPDLKSLADSIPGGGQGFEATKDA